jgi:hypothetical protein
MFPVWRRNGLLLPKARIYALRLNGMSKAYPVDVLTAARVVNDDLAGTPLVLVAAGRSVETRAIGRYGNPIAYDSGAAVRSYRRGALRFRIHADGARLLDGAGSVWRVTEDALVGPDGARLERVPGHLAYWFAWFAFFPHTLVYEKP